MGDINILIAEDSPHELELTRAALLSLDPDCHIHVATDGEQALRFLYREAPYQSAPRPDLVLLDLHLPRLDGRSLLTLLKGDPKLRVTPVIVMTQGPIDGDLAGTALGQANGHVEKPVDPSKLAQAIAALKDGWSGATLPTDTETPTPAELSAATPSYNLPLVPHFGESTAPEPLCILIIEDSDFDAKLLERHLKKAVGAMSVQITRADQLGAAKSILVSSKFDVIVVDLGLPDSRGLEGLSTLQRIAPTTPLVVLTGTADDELGRAALRAGAQDYLVKGEMGGPGLARSLRYAIERQSLTNQLMSAQRMQVLGQLAGGVAHDVNNLLTIISNNVALLAESFESFDSEALSEVRSAIQRGALLTRQLLAISQKRVFESGEIDLNTLVEQSAKLLGRSLGRVRLSLELSAKSPKVHGDYGMLEQLLMSLSLNARDAMPRGGSLRLVTDTVPESKSGSKPPAASKAEHVRLRIIDSGDGISPEILGRIWEPFFTTKESQGCTGLGLPTARSIVEQHHGEIEIRSRVGEGTEVLILFPLSPVRTIRDTLAPEPEVQPSGSRILVVDDEPAILRTCQRFLERNQHQVFTATSAETALQLWEAEDGRFDLVLTDLQMPDGMGGRELAERLRAMRPGLPIVYASGYSKDLLTRQMGIERGITFIEKPYTADELRATVGRALTQGARTSDGPASKRS